MPKYPKTKYMNLLCEMFKRHEVQEDLCKVLGLSKSAVNQRFLGRTEWKMSEINKLCKHFDKDYQYLFQTESNLS